VLAYDDAYYAEGTAATHSCICSLSKLLKLLERAGVSFAVHVGYMWSGGGRSREGERESIL
jgi:hypothetical protein